MTPQRPRAWTVGILVAAGLLTGAVQRPSPDEHVVQLVVPLSNFTLLDQAGEAKVRVAVDGVGTPHVQASSATSGVIGAYAESVIRGWQFDRRQPFQLEVTYRAKRLAPSDPCAESGIEMDRLTSHIIVARPPTEVEVSSRPNVICHPDQSEDVIAEPIIASGLVGRVVCDCTGRAPIAGAQLSVSPDPRMPRYNTRIVATDGDGGFRADGFPAGRYRIQVDDARYKSRTFFVLVRPDAADRRSIDLPVVPQPPVKSRFTAWAEEVTVPIYPLAALMAGVEGTVQLRLSVSNQFITDVNTVADSQLLARSAARNVERWKFSKTTEHLVLITYYYRLVPGDCDSDQRQTVTMRLPHTVDIVAKRFVKCG